jgi:hypothetical protein
MKKEKNAHSAKGQAVQNDAVWQAVALCLILGAVILCHILS